MSAVNWETWLVEGEGDRVIQKKAAEGAQSLTRLEQLTYDLWVADYGMRNAGDLETAVDLHPSFQEEAALIASELGLAKTAEAFRLPQSDFEACYFERFNAICSEIAAAAEQGLE